MDHLTRLAFDVYASIILLGLTVFNEFRSRLLRPVIFSSRRGHRLRMRIKEAISENIPVILVGRGINVEDDQLYLSKVAPNFVLEGRLAAYWLAQETPQVNRQCMNIQSDFDFALWEKAIVNEVISTDEQCKNSKMAFPPKRLRL